MSTRTPFISIFLACMSAAGLVGIASMANAAPGGPSVATSGESARDRAGTYVIEVKRRRRTQRIPLPLGPAYIYYDYPYYYSRGHYPTHIGGYVYYIPRARGRCAGWSRTCAAEQRSYRRSRASSRR